MREKGTGIGLIRDNLFIFLAKFYVYFLSDFERAIGVIWLRKVNNKGARCIFEGGGRLIDPQKIVLGDDVSIGRNFFIRATGGLEIGSYTHISRNVTIHTSNHNVEGELLPYDNSVVSKPIEIGRYVWVGMNSCILPGVKIGDGAIIGMGTVVSKDVLPNQIVVGAAQRCVAYRDEEHARIRREDKKFLKINNRWADYG